MLELLFAPSNDSATKFHEMFSTALAKFPPDHTQCVRFSGCSFRLGVSATDTFVEQPVLQGRSQIHRRQCNCHKLGTYWTQIISEDSHILSVSRAVCLWWKSNIHSKDGSPALSRFPRAKKPHAHCWFYIEEGTIVFRTGTRTFWWVASHTRLPPGYASEAIGYIVGVISVSSSNT